MPIKDIVEKITGKTQDGAHEFISDKGSQRIYWTVPANGTVSAQTATATLTSSSFNKILTNTGASGTITLTLPDPATVKGQSIKVQVTAAQIIRLDPPSGVAVYLGGDGVDAKYLQIAGVIGNYADVWCDGTDYHVVTYSGVLTKEA